MAASNPLAELDSGTNATAQDSGMWWNRRFDQPLPGQLGGAGLDLLGHVDRPSPDLPSTAAPAAATAAAPAEPDNQSPVWVRVLESLKWLGYTGMVIYPPPYYHSEHE